MYFQSLFERDSNPRRYTQQLRTVAQGYYPIISMRLLFANMNYGSYCKVLMPVNVHSMAFDVHTCGPTSNIKKKGYLTCVLQQMRVLVVRILQLYKKNCGHL